jgi:hypothetical protein
MRLVRIDGRRRGVAVSAVLMAVFVLAIGPSWAMAAGGTTESLRADLDGKPIKLVDVANWYCDDFSYPVIHCYSDASRLAARDALVLSVSAVDYVTIYDYTSFAGSYMQVSQDYNALITLGWNDRISSFKARNSLAGHFYVDWFYQGTGYYFCCNQQVTSLGSFDNTFSSIHSITP